MRKEFKKNDNNIIQMSASGFFSFSFRFVSLFVHASIYLLNGFHNRPYETMERKKIVDVFFFSIFCFLLFSASK